MFNVADYDNDIQAAINDIQLACETDIINSASNPPIATAKRAATLYLPGNTYTLSQPLIPVVAPGFAFYVNLVGDGLLTTIEADFDGDVIVSPTDSNGNSLMSYNHFRDFMIVHTGHSGAAFRLAHNTNNCEFTRIRVDGGDNAFLFEDVGYSICNRFDKCVLGGQAQSCISLGRGSNATTLSGCSFLNSPVGVDLLGASDGVFFSGCMFENNGVTPLRLLDSLAVVVSGGYIEFSTPLAGKPSSTVGVIINGVGKVVISGVYINAKGGILTNQPRQVASHDNSFV